MSRGMLHHQTRCQEDSRRGIQPHSLNGLSLCESSLVQTPVRVLFLAGGGEALFPPVISSYCRDGALPGPETGKRDGGQDAHHGPIRDL